MPGRRQKSVAVPRPGLAAFAAGNTGSWRIERIDAIRGDGLAQAQRLAIDDGGAAAKRSNSAWTLQGVVSNLRYTTASEQQHLAVRQAGLGRNEATRAALIPIRKSDAWWELAQDQRRAIFEQQSKHIAIGADYLPAVARRLYHCRELGEPFDFLTWFEYTPQHEPVFDRLVARLRASEEWKFVTREVDIRLTRDGGQP